MPSRPCLVPGCPDFATYKGRCPEHARGNEKVIRSKEEGRVYDRRRWHVLRRKKLAANPICESCGEALARDVDHVTPIEDGGDPWAMSNLSSLCSPCHSAKTNREVRERNYG